MCFIQRDFLIMDGSSMRVLNEIMELAKDLSGRYNRRFVKLKSLSSERPGIKLVKTRMSRKDFLLMERVMDERYPGLCVFHKPIGMKWA